MTAKDMGYRKLNIGEIYGTCTVPSYPVIILGHKEGGSQYYGALLRVGEPLLSRRDDIREVGKVEGVYGPGLFDWHGELTDEELALAMKLLLLESC